MSKNSTVKKSSTKRSGSSKKKSKSQKNTKNKQLSLTEIIFKREFSATVTFIAGLLLLIIALFSGGADSLWNNIHSYYFALFGICGYYIPLAVLFYGVTSLINKQETKHFFKGAEIFFAFVLLCSFFHVNKVADSQLGFADSIRNILSESQINSFSSLTNGGILGAVFGGVLFQLCKSVALTNVILSIVLIADLMLLFGISLVKVFMGMEKPAKKLSEITENAIEKSKKDIAKRRQERIEEREIIKERKNKNVDPARILNDFCDADDEKEKSESKKRSKIKKIDTDISESSDDENIFSFTLPKMQDESKINDFEEIKDEANEAYSESENIAPEQTAPEKKKEALEPLSAKEEKELKESLDNAVNQVHNVQYILPPLDCLNRPKASSVSYNEAELKSNGEKLIAALNSFNVSASIVGVVPGPSVTRYELAPAPGVKISKFVGLADDLALHMASPAGLRIEAPIPNKAAIGIEIPNRNKTTVTFRESIDNDKFRNSQSKLTVALGKDISGTPMFSNLAKMPHLLVAGTTGSGKSVCLNSMIVSILYNATPDEVNLLLIDPKQVEFGIYNGLPHLLVPVVSDPRKAAGALGWAVTEMLSRYKTLNANGVRDIAAYNSLCDERDDLVKLPHIVIFIDELADLMTVAPSEVEDSIQRLAQMARAAGMHLVVATQRPSVDVITGVIKSNIPSRIALTVKSYVDSKIIIDTAGAEKLMGNGDMLYYPVGVPKPVRIQGCYLSDAEIENVVQFIKGNSATNYDDNVQQEIDRQAVAEKKKTEEPSSSGIDSGDDLFMRAVELFVGAPEKASISALQRHLGLGFAKAGRLMDTLEQKGIVGPHMGSKPRNVLVTKAQWYEMNAMSDTAGAVGDVSDATTDSDGDNE